MPFEMRSWFGLLPSTGSSLGLLALAAFVASAASVGWAQDAEPAAAEPGDSAMPAPPPSDPELVRHRCRLFATELDATIDTWDRSTALGQWVLAQQDAGWRVDAVDMNVGRKSTGFVQAWTQICMVPRESRQPTE